MSLARLKVWKRNETLLSTDLNAEFDNIIQNAGDATFPLSSDLEVGSKLLINTGFQSPLQLHDGVHAIEGKYSSSLPVAIASIGSSRITLLIGSAITIGADATIPDNVLLWCVGPGKLFVNSGVTLTINSPAQIMAGTQQQVFDGTGTVSFTNPGIVAPGWWGFTASGTDSTNKTAYNAATASLPSTGGTIIIPPGTYSVSDSLTHGNKPVSVVGAHPELCVISSTADASLKHGLIFTRSHHVRNLTIKTSSDLTSNRQMYATRMDLDGVTVSGGNLSVRYDSIKVRGFNNGIYVDGGDAYNVDRAFFGDLDLKVAGPASDYIGSCLYIHRVHQLYGVHSQFNQNNTGEHAIYCFGSKNIVFDGFKIRNATRTEAQAIKLVGNGVAPDDDQAYPTWSVRNMDIADCTHGVVCSIYGTETLEALHVENCTFQNLTDTTGILAHVYVSVEDTAAMRAVLVNNVSTRNSGYQGVHVSIGTGSTMGTIAVTNCNAYNWSTASAGTYTWFGTSGDGTFGPIHVANITGNGNSNGRTLLGATGQSNSVARLTYENLKESNTTSPGWPVTDSDTSATFNFAIGNTWKVSGTRTVTAASNASVDQTYVIIGTNANCTFTDNSTFKLNGNWVSAADKSLVLKCIDSTPTFIELARSVN